MGIDRAGYRALRTVELSRSRCSSPGFGWRFSSAFKSGNRPACRGRQFEGLTGCARALGFAAKKRAGAPYRSAGPICSGGGIRTRDLRVMRTSYSFRCRQVPFVVWTFSSPSAEPLGACRQVSTPSPESGLGSGLPVKASPNLTGDHAQVSSRAARGLRISCTACKEHATPIEPDELPAAPPRDVGPAIIRTHALTCNEPLVQP